MEDCWRQAGRTIKKVEEGYVIQSPGGFARTTRVVLVFAFLLVSLASHSFAQDDSIRRTYVWAYGGKTWTFTYDFPTSAYELHKSLTRTLDYTAYDVYVNDPRDDAVLQDFMAKLEQTAVGLNIWERLNLIIECFLFKAYTKQSITTPIFPHVKHNVELIHYIQLVAFRVDDIPEIIRIDKKHYRACPI